MTYEDFKQHFDEWIFGSIKHDLLKKLAEEPERYIGIFRSTLPKGKILQNLTQSQEIQFGDAFEALITKYLAECGFENLPKDQQFNGEALNLDQYFKKDGKYYFVEQKMRDDHDSTKKRGQIDNFTKKVDFLISIHGQNVEAFLFFVDTEMDKNKSYYTDEATKLQQSKNIPVHVCYGRDFFERIEMGEVWDEIERHLRRWRSEIPEYPNTNFDEDSEDSFNQLKQLSPTDMTKILENNEIFTNFIPILFPQKDTLHKLLDYYLAESNNGENNNATRTKYQKVYALLKEKLEQ